MNTDKAPADFRLHWSLDGGDTGQGTGGTQEFLTVEVHSQDVKKTGYGKAREARPAAPGEEAAFTYSSILENWKKLVGGEIGPIRGIVSRKFKLKGNIVKVMRYMKAAQLLVDTVGKVPTKFHDE